MAMVLEGFLRKCTVFIKTGPAVVLHRRRRVSEKEIRRVGERERERKREREREREESEIDR